MRISFEITPAQVVRWFIGLLLIWAALSKLGDLARFHSDVAAYRLPLPARTVRFAAVTLPWLELLCGLLLCAKLLYRPALGWSILLFAGFAMALGQAWARGLGIKCGCFDEQMLGIEVGRWLGDWFDSPSVACLRALLLLGGACWLWRQSELESKRPTGGPLADTSASPSSSE